MKKFSNKNNIKVLWTIFKISRQKDGSYMPDLSIDEKWVAKQKLKLESWKSPTLIVFADVFAKYVYKCDISANMKIVYSNSVLESLSFIENLIDVRFESDLIDEFWNLSDFLVACDKEVFSDDQVSIESEKRRALYNDKGYPISLPELKDISKKALSCIKIEELLEKRFSV